MFGIPIFVSALILSPYVSNSSARLVPFISHQLEVFVKEKKTKKHVVWFG